MNIKKATKIVSMMLVVFMMMTVLSTTVFAGAPDPSKYTGDGTVETTKIDTLGQNIIKIISTIGSVISVIVLIILGIKYMMGSAEEKAEYKKTLLPYIIGAALVFAASTIASVVFNFANSLKV